MGGFLVTNGERVISDPSGSSVKRQSYWLPEGEAFFYIHTFPLKLLPWLIDLPLLTLTVFLAA